MSIDVVPITNCLLLLWRIGGWGGTAGEQGTEAAGVSAFILLCSLNTRGTHTHTHTLTHTIKHTSKHTSKHTLTHTSTGGGRGVQQQQQCSSEGDSEGGLSGSELTSPVSQAPSSMAADARCLHVCVCVYIHACIHVYA
jgi:hypothetical protein